MTDEQNSGARRRRVPYFERPRPPRDWRFWVGGLGRTMIILGLLVFAFVAYQLWGTGIQTARAQRTLRGEFAQSLSSTTSTTVPTPASSEAGTTTTTLPPFPSDARVALGQPMAHLEISSIKLDYVVVEGVRVRDLQQGPGHFPESKQPGQYGNVAIACHRTTYGAPCYDLDHVAIGDEIRITTKTGVYVYRATGSEVVDPSEYRQVVPTLDRHSATLAITTCTPIGTARSRLVLHAALDLSQSGQLFGATAPPTTTSTTVTTTASTSASNTTSSTINSTSTTTSTSPTTTDPFANLDSNDAFAQGWFDRPSLVVQCLVWAAILTAIVVASYLTGRRFRRVWVCFAVGVLPFVVTLYFTFENLNLLLPASI